MLIYELRITPCRTRHGHFCHALRVATEVGLYLSLDFARDFILSLPKDLAYSLYGLSREMRGCLGIVSFMPHK